MITKIDSKRSSQMSLEGNVKSTRCPWRDLRDEGGCDLPLRENQEVNFQIPERCKIQEHLHLIPELHLFLEEGPQRTLVRWVTLAWAPMVVPLIPELREVHLLILEPSWTLGTPEP
jgi:hypothetical protein